MEEFTSQTPMDDETNLVTDENESDLEKERSSTKNAIDHSILESHSDSLSKSPEADETLVTDENATNLEKGSGTKNTFDPSILGNDSDSSVKSPEEGKTNLVTDENANELEEERSSTKNDTEFSMIGHDSDSSVKYPYEDETNLVTDENVTDLEERSSTKNAIDPSDLGQESDSSVKSSEEDNPSVLRQHSDSSVTSPEDETVVINDNATDSEEHSGTKNAIELSILGHDSDSSVKSPEEDKTNLVTDENATELEEERSITETVNPSVLGHDSDSSGINRIWFNITQPKRIYYERENEMEALQNYWKECIKNPTTLLIVEITGITGAGKTELTKNFVHKFYSGKKCHCVWIDGENLKSISHSFRKLAAELRISIRDSRGKEKPIDFLIREVYRMLFNSECIIVIDNFEDCNQSFLSSLIEFANRQPLLDGKPLVILISCNGLTKTTLQFETNEIELHPFTHEMATSFVVAEMNFSEKDGKCIALAEILGDKLKCNPLAMAQAVAYLKLRRKSLGAETNINKYLNLLEQEEKNISPHLEHLSEHSKAPCLTMEVSMKKIMKVPSFGSKVRMMMNILSFFAADTAINNNFAMGLLGAIPTRTANGGIKSKIRNSNPFKKQKCIFKVLHDYMLCQMVEIQRENFVLILRNVQEIIRAGLEEDGEATKILSNLLEGIGKNLTKGEIPMSQMIHIEKIWKHATNNRELVQKHGYLPRKIVTKYLKGRKFREAFDFSCGAVKALEDVFGEEHRLTLNMKYWKGVAYKERNELKDSLEILREVHEKETRIFGAEDHECLLTGREVGIVLLKQGKFEEAKIMLEDVKKIREKVNGPEHRETLKLIGDLACVHYEGREHEEAVNVYEKLEEMEERLFGAEDLRTLSTKHNIATIKFHRGEYDDALQIFHQVFQVKERILESDHPDVLETKIWLAVTYKCLGRHEEALKLARETHDSRLNILGMQDHQTISAKELVTELESLLKRSSFE